MALVILNCGLATTGMAVVDWPQLRIVEVASGVSQPVHVTHSGDGSGRLFVVEQTGRIQIVQSNAVLTTPFLDISARVQAPEFSEDGMLSVVFPRNYAAKGVFYVYYTRVPDGASVISRFRVSAADANQADPASEQMILVVEEGYLPALNGGLMTFGPDGYLYVGLGDSGFNLAAPSFSQDKSSLWGKILRIDVESVSEGYAIPPGNPFVGLPGAKGEIWVLGLRNPWRISFDAMTGDLFIADVGQNVADEINFQPASSAGGENYGWRLQEGSFNYDPLSSDISRSLTPPISTYMHTGAIAAVIGGFVYRGPGPPRINGVYFYADFYQGRILGLQKDGTNWVSETLLGENGFISSFGLDESGRLYFVDYAGGSMHRIEDNGKAAAPMFEPPAGISYTGTIRVNSLSAGGRIHYTMDGSDPDEADPFAVSGETVTVVSGATLKARTLRGDLAPSDMVNATFNLKVAAPAANPSGGPITNGTLVALSTITPGATIRYTTDGTEPQSSSPAYSGPFPAEGNTVVKARGFRSGFADSSMLVVDYAAPPFKILATGWHQNFWLYFSWNSTTNRKYQVQQSLDLVNWHAVGAPLDGTGDAVSFTNLTLLQLRPRGSFRVSSFIP